MFIKVKRGWEIPERLATPEHVFFNRRRFLATGAAVGAMSILSACDEKQEAQAEADAAPPAPDPSAALYPFKRNETYKLDRDLTTLPPILPSEPTLAHYVNVFTGRPFHPMARRATSANV